MSLIFKGKRKEILTFVFLFSLFFISLVSAQPPPTTSVVININTGVAIDFPKQDILEQNQAFHFHFHIFNISNGVRLDNTTTNCTFELFDNRGNHLIDSILGFLDDDFEINVTGGNFSRIGDYHYLVDCVTDGGGGFISAAIKVTPTGLVNLFGFYIIILLISATLIVIGFWMKDPWIIMFGTFGLYFTGLYIMLNGIVGIKDMVTTWAIALIILGVAAYLSIRAAQEVVNG